MPYVLFTALVFYIAWASTAVSIALDEASIVTLVVTSCKRPTSLKSMLDSLFEVNTYKFRAVLIAEASGVLNVNADVVSKYPFVTVLGGARRSQVENIDAAYAQVKTPYILHFEEDWLVFRDGFVKRSIAVLGRFPKVSVVSLHAVGSSEWQKIEGEELMPGVGYMKRDTSGGWGYFTWGAGLRRMSDYLLVGDYRRYNASWKSNGLLQQEARAESINIKKHFIHREWKINWLYKSKGFRVALFNDSLPYAKHSPISKEVHVPDERGSSPFER
jgi:hypothetical protein